VNRSLRRHIPSFSLYGEQTGTTRRTDPLHIEDIQSRSSKYLWKIDTHQHTGLCQCVYLTAGPAVADLEGSHADFEAPTVFIIPAGTVHGFGFRADSQGYVLTMDLDRLLSMAGATHRAPIAALFSAPRAIDLASDRLLAARSAQLFETLMQEFRQPESLMVPVSGWLACSVLWILASTSMATMPTGLLGRYDLDRLRRFRVHLHTIGLEEHVADRRVLLGDRRLALDHTSVDRRHEGHRRIEDSGRLAGLDQASGRVGKNACQTSRFAGQDVQGDCVTSNRGRIDPWNSAIHGIVVEQVAGFKIIGTVENQRHSF